jgi:putative DNA methylase
MPSVRRGSQRIFVSYNWEKRRLLEYYFFWHNGAAHLKIVNTFSRQAIPMTWDFAEGNPFSESSGHYLRFVSLKSEVIDLTLSAYSSAQVTQADAQSQTISTRRLISTDPPYYDNICYADLSDFFYVWLRRSLRDVYPNLLSRLQKVL